MCIRTYQRVNLPFYTDLKMKGIKREFHSEGAQRLKNLFKSELDHEYIAKAKLKE
jgi:hypothetical protein